VLEPVPSKELHSKSETTRMHRVAGLTGGLSGLGHHPTVSRASSYHLRCGADRGGHVPMPGEVSLAHNMARIPWLRVHRVDVGLGKARRPLQDHSISTAASKESGVSN
jgi:hypothetical protein